MLDAHGASLVLSVEVLTMDTAKTHSVKALLNCGVTGSFIDKDFV